METDILKIVNLPWMAVKQKVAICRSKKLPYDRLVDGKIDTQMCNQKIKKIKLAKIKTNGCSKNAMSLILNMPCMTNKNNATKG